MKQHKEDAGASTLQGPSASQNHVRVKVSRLRWPEWTALFLQATVIAFAIVHHEPCADEAQAWQLARSLSLPTLFHTYIRYEASPGLWHFVLWILIRLHVSYCGLHWICGGISVGATALILFKSPFPRYLKLALPFTFFLLFQYAVVARSYVLVPPLLYLVAIRWKKSPAVVALLLGLLANASLHAAAISGGLTAVFLLERIRGKSLGEIYKSRQLMGAVSIVVAFDVFALWTAWPPPDMSSHLAATLQLQSSPFLIKVLIALCMGVCRPWFLAIPFWIAIALWLSARRSLIYLLPLTFFALFCGEVSVGWWHSGLVIPQLICVLWITWPEQPEPIGWKAASGLIALVAVACLQITWSAYAVKYDYANDYSAALTTSKFLRPMVMQHKAIALTSLYDPYCDAYHAVEILPYFDRNIFVNLPDSFWSWGDHNQTEANFELALRSRPPVIVVEGRSLTEDVTIKLQDPEIDLLNQSGYRMTNMFCGAWPDPADYREAERTCELIFQPAN
jgi:hypothetical protein